MFGRCAFSVFNLTFRMVQITKKGCVYDEDPQKGVSLNKSCKHSAK